MIVCGTIRGEFTLNHETHGEKFYVASIDSKRLSGRVDSIPVMVSERLVDVTEDWGGQTVLIEGDMRSHNSLEHDRNHLHLHVFAKYFAECGAGESDDNEIYLDGYICQDVRYRETPLGREVSDLMLAVNRPYWKSDYIPCICWGRNAMFSASLEKGTHLRVKGRIQSREYHKRISEEEYEQRTAYEVSVSSLEVISDDFAEED